MHICYRSVVLLLSFRRSIFGEIGDYVPAASTERSSKHREHSRRDGDHRDRERDRDRDHDRDHDRDRKRSSYFEKPSLEDERDRGFRSHRGHDSRWSSADTASAVAAAVAAVPAQMRDDGSRLKAKLTSKLERDLPESYAECYPGYGRSLSFKILEAVSHISI